MTAQFTTRGWKNRYNLIITLVSTAFLFVIITQNGKFKSVQSYFARVACEFCAPQGQLTSCLISSAFVSWWDKSWRIFLSAEYRQETVSRVLCLQGDGQATFNWWWSKQRGCRAESGRDCRGQNDKCLNVTTCRKETKCSWTRQTLFFLPAEIFDLTLAGWEEKDRADGTDGSAFPQQNFQV